jgi:multidrug resistance protein
MTLELNPRLIIFLVSFAAFLGPFTQTIYTPILPEIQSDFQTTQFLINLTISIFTIVLAGLQIVYGPLTDSKGRRKVLLPGIALYVLASIGCAYSQSIGMLLLCRAIQAAGIATGSVVATTVIGDLFEGKMRGRAMGTFQMLVALGPVVGPVVGGFVGANFGFHGVFWVLAATGLVMLLANWRYLPETKPELPAQRFQLRNFASILAEPTGSAVILLGFVQYYTFYNFLVFLPDILTKVYNFSAEKKGLLFLPMSLALVLGSFLGGRLQEKVEPRKSLILTTSLNVIAIVFFILVAKLSIYILIVAIAVFGLCLGLSLPVQTTLLTSAFTRERATAIGVYNFFRYIGMAAGPIVGSVLYAIGGIPLLFGFAAVVFAAVVLFARQRLIGTSHSM